MEVISNKKDIYWFKAPRNVAFTMIGWLYGENNFGKSVFIAMNCGDDTECTGAALGSVLGIIGGIKAIPEKLRKPVSNKIVTVAISGLPFDTFGIENDGRKTNDMLVLADTISDNIIKCSLILTRSSASDNIPTTLFKKNF